MRMRHGCAYNKEILDQLAFPLRCSFTLIPSPSTWGQSSVRINLEDPSCLYFHIPFFCTVLARQYQSQRLPWLQIHFDIFPAWSLYKSDLEQELPYARITHTPLKAPADKADVICRCVTNIKERNWKKEKQKGSSRGQVISDSALIFRVNATKLIKSHHLTWLKNVESKLPNQK